MKRLSILLATAVLLPALAFSADYNLRDLAKAKKLEVFNRTLDPARADAPEGVFLNAAANDGVAWITGVEFSAGTIQLEIKGKDQQGQSFVGIAFHGQDNETFDAVYLRPFNFQSPEEARRSHSIQYISMPGHDWSRLRNDHPGKYEAGITPAPAPESWVKLKLVIEGKHVSAFVNGSDNPALKVELLNGRLKGKVGLWVGNGSDGWFKNLEVAPSEQATATTTASATAKQVDLGTPSALTKRVIWLMGRSDAEQLRKMTHAVGTEEVRFRDAFIKYFGSCGRLHELSVARFGPAGGNVSLVNGADDASLEQLRLEEEITGEEALVRLPEGNQPSVVYFDRVDGVWKFRVYKSLKSVMDSCRLPGTPCEKVEAMVKGLDEFMAKVKSGQYSTAEEARDELRAAMGF
jgi:hypothetical protein